MKILVITDVHANLPALRAVMHAVENEGLDAIYHTGDAIGIGPHPAECLDLLLSTPNIRFVMGNHDAYFANGIAASTAARMGAGEAEHQRWTHAQLAPELRAVVRAWPYRIQAEIEGTVTTFVHYALDASGQNFCPIVRNPTPEGLDAAFAADGSALAFYGHDHRASDLMGRCRYCSPGSLGCADTPIARYAVIEARPGSLTVDYRAARYDDAMLIRDFEQRRVPDRDLIRKAFFGGRFGSAGPA